MTLIAELRRRAKMSDGTDNEYVLQRIAAIEAEMPLSLDEQSRIGRAMATRPGGYTDRGWLRALDDAAALHYRVYAMTAPTDGQAEGKASAEAVG
jgi:hypothetical protein